MRKYNIINNTLGWLTFIIAAVTYMLTLEPTASFWDCPEFIAQGYKMEIGHPPGNPIFILVARFATLFAGGDVAAVSVCVNAMSALLSAATILLLFWTITHLVKRLMIKTGEEDSITLAQYLVIMGSGLAGALAYTWSDTFWYSAVEAEVYAFSSFCTALVFWLILKWENRADSPQSDRYIILIAYVFGVSLGVHLLNLLCIPAIVLIYYYRKWEKTSAKGSLIALLISFVIIVLILYGLEPGFVELAQYFELLFVNTFWLPFNSGTVAYAIITLAAMSWALFNIYTGKSEFLIKFSFCLTIILSGIPFIGESMIIPFVLIVALAVWLFKYCKYIPKRIFANVVWCILMVFVGFSSYGLIIIRSNANTPLDENSPNSPFALQSYLSREQYGKSPLLYGQTFNSSVVYQTQPDGSSKPWASQGRTLYAREVKSDPSQPDRYVAIGTSQDYKYNPELNMLFPRIHDPNHAREYKEWLDFRGEMVYATTRVDRDGNTTDTEMRLKPTMLENIRFFIEYQLNYMYWRYFMWNFAGRQNDIQGMGEITQGNWISGIPFFDNMRLGDQSMLPSDLGAGNKGHNVFFMLPLLLGIIGLLWQAYRGKRGIEQFWVIFFLFFMTGIAIVMYLNQTPSQPRERDYAYAGSFYAYSIWIGMGVAGLWHMAMALIKKKAKGQQKQGETAPASDSPKAGLALAAVAALIGILVPLQMVSQTWDDHDRSGRYAARDFGRNYLTSAAQNGVIFCNGDNDTFPLWYNQEVEGYRTDVRVVNLSYLSTDWYISQLQRAAYDSKPLPMQAGRDTYAYDAHQFNYFISPDTARWIPATMSLKELYSPESSDNIYGVSEFEYPLVFMDIDKDAVIKQKIVPENRADMIEDVIRTNLLQSGGSGLTSSQVMCLDIIASSIEQGWKRPCYFAMTVPDSYYLGLTPYLRNTGMCYQVTPLFGESPTGDIPCNTDVMYENVKKKFLWGGIDKAEPGTIYLDETVRRMVQTVRTSLMCLAVDLAYEGYAGQRAKESGKTEFMGMPVDKYIADRFDKSMEILTMMEAKLPAKACPYSITIGERLVQAYNFLGEHSGNKKAKDSAIRVLEDEIMHFAEYTRYYQTLDASLYSRLTNMDRYIDQRYLPELINFYSQINEKGVESLLKKLAAMGVSLERLQSVLSQEDGEQATQEAAYEEAVADSAQ
ncbi:MAG: DUF2723 domain-containing protein [Muribaculaceae bacterium]|nr:DUF2723 domain-containing protein [Muribaculaceae bacterium]